MQACVHARLAALALHAYGDFNHALAQTNTPFLQTHNGSIMIGCLQMQLCDSPLVWSSTPRWSILQPFCCRWWWDQDIVAVTAGTLLTHTIKVKLTGTRQPATCVLLILRHTTWPSEKKTRVLFCCLSWVGRENDVGSQKAELSCSTCSQKQPTTKLPSNTTKLLKFIHSIKLHKAS